MVEGGGRGERVAVIEEALLLSGSDEDDDEGGINEPLLM